MEDSLEAARARQYAAEKAAHEDQLFYYVLYREFPQFGCDANEALIRQFHGGEDITAESIREAIAALQGKLAILSKSDVKERAAASDSQERDQLLGQLKELGASDSLKLKAKYMATPDLKAKVTELANLAVAKTLSHDQLKKAAKLQTTVGFPELPANVSRENLLMLASNDLRAFKTLVKRYGNAQVDARLNNRIQ